MYIQSREDYIERLVNNFGRAVTSIFVGRALVLEVFELVDVEEEIR